MGRAHCLRSTAILTLSTTALLAATSLARAIDPNASVTLQRENQQAASQAQNMAERITRMEDEIERINAELISLRERKIEPQQLLQAQEDFQ